MKEFGIAVCANALVVTAIGALCGKANTNRALKLVLGLYILITLAVPLKGLIPKLSSISLPEITVNSTDAIKVYETTATQMCMSYLREQGIEDAKVSLEIELDENGRVWLLSASVDSSSHSQRASELLTGLLGVEVTALSNGG